MNPDNQNNIVEVIIKKTRSVFYVITEETLENLKRNSIVGDLFIFLSSISAGLYFSEKDGIFLIFGIIFFLIAAYYYYVKYSAIRNLKKSGELDPLADQDSDAKKALLKIIKATYGTPTNTIDVTKELQNMIKDNKLNTKANNNIAGDPHIGVGKVLSVIYERNGKVESDNFPESSDVNL